MRSNELIVGDVVAVVSSKLYLGVPHGPQKAVVKALKVKSPDNDRNLKTEVDVYNYDGTLQKTCFLDGKNIVGYWKDFEAGTQSNWNKWEFARKQQQIRKEQIQRKEKRDEMLRSKCYTLLQALGVIPPKWECKSYRLEIPNGADFHLLDEILSDALRRRNSPEVFTSEQEVEGELNEEEA